MQKNPLNKFRNIVGRHWHNIPGWSTNRKIVVFESDDWGSIRMPSREVYELFRSKGYPVEHRPFELFDTLETKEDLLYLYDTLLRYRDKNGNHPVFTAFYIMTNPDFVRIKNSGFLEYYSEPFYETIDKYYGSKNLLSLLNQGISEGVFSPQFHGNSHFNIRAWLRLLRQGHSDTLLAFQNGMVGITSKENPQIGNQLMVALCYENDTDIEEQKKEIKEGCNIFEKIFGYRPRSFVAPCYTWSEQIEPTLLKEGIEFLHGAKYQLNACKGNVKQKTKKHITGEKNEHGQIYLIRNIYFEPSTDNNRDWVTYVLNNIKTAFFWKKPAIISSHRLNYVGRIQPENRKKNIKLLNTIISNIVSTWPEVEFFSSTELGDLIKENINI